MDLSEKEAHCVARLLQGAMFGESVLNGCRFCKFRCKGQDDLDAIRKRLYEETGVDLRLDAESNLLYSKFPYKRFLKNSNESIFTPKLFRAIVPSPHMTFLQKVTK